MPRTRTWNESQPVGTVTPSRDIDNEFRALKVDIREITNQIYGVSENTPLADPAVPSSHTLSAMKTLLDANAGSVVLTMTLPWYGIRSSETGTVTVSRERYAVSGASAAGRLFIPVPLPVGVTITRVGFRVLRQSTNHSLTLGFYRMTGPDVSGSTIVDAPPASSVAQWANSGTLSIVTLQDEYFAFDVTLNNNNQTIGLELALFAVQVRYTSPNAKVRI